MSLEQNQHLRVWNIEEKAMKHINECLSNSTLGPDTDVVFYKHFPTNVYF